MHFGFEMNIWQPNKQIFYMYFMYLIHTSAAMNGIETKLQNASIHIDISTIEGSVSSSYSYCDFTSFIQSLRVAIKLKEYTNVPNT